MKKYAKWAMPLMLAAALLALALLLGRKGPGGESAVAGALFVEAEGACFSWTFA